MTFQIKITGLRTQTINGIENAVKQVEWTMVGSEGAQTFELPQTTTVPDPQSDGFIPLANLTEAEVVAWIEAHDERIPAIQAHIQLVLDREVAKAQLQPATMPWAPVPETTEPAPAP
jgi:hypothetical protein